MHAKFPSLISFYVVIFCSNSREYFPNGNEPFNALVTYPYNAATCDYEIRLKEDSIRVFYHGTCDKPCKWLAL